MLLFSHFCPGDLNTHAVCHKPTRSTQPSTLHGTVKWVGPTHFLCWVVINGLQAAYRQTCGSNCLVCFARCQPPGAVLHSSSELGELLNSWLLQWPCHDDSTINIICPWCYYYQSPQGPRNLYAMDAKKRRFSVPFLMTLCRQIDLPKSKLNQSCLKCVFLTQNALYCTYKFASIFSKNFRGGTPGFP